MEMPIKVMITLFVTLVVGVLIIQFATSSVTDSKKKILELGEDEEDMRDRVLEVADISSHQIASLSEDCYKEFSLKGLEDELCYVILGEVEATKQGIIEAFEFGEGNISVSLTSNSRAVQISYSAAKNIIEVEG